MTSSFPTHVPKVFLIIRVWTGYRLSRILNANASFCSHLFLPRLKKRFPHPPFRNSIKPTWDRTKMFKSRYFTSLILGEILQRSGINKSFDIHCSNYFLVFHVLEINDYIEYSWWNQEKDFSILT